MFRNLWDWMTRKNFSAFQIKKKLFLGGSVIYQRNPGSWSEWRWDFCVASRGCVLCHLWLAKTSKWYYIVQLKLCNQPADFRARVTEGYLTSRVLADTGI